MSNSFMNGLQNATNYGYTTNGALSHKTTGNDLLDMFAQAGAYRRRTDNDCILLFKNAYIENPKYALKCLFYMRDIRGGQGERRFFRVCYKWLIGYDKAAAKRNLQYMSEYGRWDDLLYICQGTSLWNDAMQIVRSQLMLDMDSCNHSDKTGISLLAKWMPSENTSSAVTRALAHDVRTAFGFNHRQYRKTLSVLRDRLNVLERLMSAGRWDEIEFDKIPSKAGMKYKNAFARRDMIAQKYEKFAKDENTKVNAKALYPYEVVEQARGCHAAVDRAMINKYWDNLEDYFNGATLDALCVIDTSGSMTWGSNRPYPIDVAISLGLYCAERARGPFAGNYVSFSSRPQLIRTEGIDFVDKVYRIYRTNLCQNTNIEATFDLLLNTAIRNRCKQEDLPKSLIVISDMQFDQARGVYYGDRHYGVRTLMEKIEEKWNQVGYKMPNLVFWNVNATANPNMPMEMKDGVSYVSGCSPVIFKQILTGKTAFDLMYEVLDAERYAVIG